MSAGAAPSLQDAQRAADAVAHLDAGIVLVYGSVALGTATEDSDIDLCLVFDDLGDYSQRQSLKNTAQDAVRQATGKPANVRVCDRPEWRALRECVSSFERHIASHAVVLRERPPRHDDWDKQIPGPVTSAELAERILGNVDLPLIQLSAELNLCGNAHADHAQETGTMSPADDETWVHRRLRRYRAEVCVRALAVIEISLIAVNHSLPGPHLPKLALDVAGAIEAMPLRDTERAALQAAVAGLDRCAAVDFRDNLRSRPSAASTVRSTKRCVAEPGASKAQSTASHVFRKAVSKLVSPSASTGMPW